MYLPALNDGGMGGILVFELCPNFHIVQKPYYCYPDAQIFWCSWIKLYPAAKGACYGMQNIGQQLEFSNF